MHKPCQVENRQPASSPLSSTKGGADSVAPAVRRGSPIGNRTYICRYTFYIPRMLSDYPLCLWVSVVKKLGCLPVRSTQTGGYIALELQYLCLQAEPTALPLFRRQAFAVACNSALCCVQQSCITCNDCREACTKLCLRARCFSNKRSAFRETKFVV